MNVDIAASCLSKIRAPIMDAMLGIQALSNEHVTQRMTTRMLDIVGRIMALGI